MAGRARRLATAWLAVAACLLGAAGPATADHPLKPDLVTVKLRASEVFVSQEGKKTLLRLANRVGNAGAGPLEVRPSEEPTDCDGDGDSTDELIGYQRVYEHPWVFGSDANTFAEPEVGCVVYHAAHSHWHVASIARYSLLSEATGKTTAGNKVGFCLLDSGRIDGGTAAGSYGDSGCGSSKTLPSLTGISPGYFDLYGSNTPGQRINVTGLKRGRYCLRSTANPKGHLRESNLANNVAEMRIRLNPKRGVVRKVSRTCKLPA